ncbi:uncharacterized protein (DUF952 family) [Rhodococcus sp. 27YEA15]|uniref:DUF952 domain-containing protein n=1 Tax=Rhodococcus sp. 27YEA15 TaxID=3156259 RepID=UPI003C7AEBD3
MGSQRQSGAAVNVELLHMCARTEWEVARELGRREPDSFSAEGFVHMSTPAQVHLPANRLFTGRDDIVLLVLDPELLGAEVKWEPGDPSDPDSMRFPHLYGPIPTAAVIDVRDYVPNESGVFPALA